MGVADAPAMAVMNWIMSVLATVLMPMLVCLRMVVIGRGIRSRLEPMRAVVGIKPAVGRSAGCGQQGALSQQEPEPYDEHQDAGEQRQIGLHVLRYQPG